MNELPYNLTVFKSLSRLHVEDASVSKIEDLGPVRNTLKCLTASRCNIRNLSEILLCDSVHNEEIEERPGYIWTELESLNLSRNSISKIDKSLVLTRGLKYLNLSSNKITSVGNYLTKLPQLLQLDLSANQLDTLDDLHTKFGNITKLNLSQNNLTDLKGLFKLYSIIILNLSSNRIQALSDVEGICGLPCLEEINLSGNPVTTCIDYRVKILEMFGKRSSEICLDNERPTQKELDKVAILQALRTAREGKLPVLTLSHPLPSSPLNLSLEKTDVGAIARE